MLQKVDISLLRRGDIVRFDDLELAQTWFVEYVDDVKILLVIDNFYYDKTKLLRKNRMHKKYVFVEIE